MAVAAVLLYASIFVADGKYADYCCSSGDLPTFGTTGSGKIYSCCCEAYSTCATKTHHTGSNEITLFDVTGPCKKGFCSPDVDQCKGSGAEAPKCSKLDNLGTTNNGAVIVYKTYTRSAKTVAALRSKFTSPVPVKVANDHYSLVQSPSRSTTARTAAQLTVQSDAFDQFFLNLERSLNFQSGGNVTATAEEVDEVMDKFLADAEMELSNPVLITGVGAVFVILLAAIYCFCCKKKRGANDSRSESHGRQHPNKRNATRYTKPRKESRKAHE